MHVNDLVVAGFGPSGISLAAAVEDHDDDHPQDPPLTAAYLEQAADSAWQPYQVLPGTDIQHHFLRDLATPRDAASRFGFVPFLQQSGRFYEFTLLGGYVSRLEWSSYVQWAAAQVRQRPTYHREVVSVEPVADADGVVRAARVLSRDPRDGARHEDVGRNVVIATGHRPHIPEVFREAIGEQVFHAHEFLLRAAALPEPPEGRPRRWAVIGAGQTAGEIVLYLHGSDPRAEVHSLVRHAGFRMYELGHFSNEVYFPGETDYVYGLERQARDRVMEQARATNYSAVDPDVSTALYAASYQDKLTGSHRLSMHRRTEVTGVRVRGDGVVLDTAEVFTGERGSLVVDAVVLCTGYTEPVVPHQLAPFASLLSYEDDGLPVVTRGHRALTTGACEVGIYLDGVTEWRHGIASATSFSQMAVKADAVHHDLREQLARQRAAAAGAGAHTAVHEPVGL
ncbi:SidA/IucD/PvdA family monooxygenase [Streptomyces montanisoli]|uniref:L-lysine N6-monooxygenase MbtG n=1 Tax=Streptomyces montanisoli TaxID=2798581 RepID=A0A940S032_9ACTN|nr:SidA/IucD/PvdA family monooxygenase [Streptomyces montanisoli]MBP0460434.1 SidA/IucD/PvdA family monooxygenase [Streptomyces montanisoli]